MWLTMRQKTNNIIVIHMAYALLTCGEQLITNLFSWKVYWLTVCVYVWMCVCVCGGGPMASTPYQGVAPRQLSFSSPGSTISGSFISPPDGQTSVVFSYKHRGLCLYLARILRFVWVGVVFSYKHRGLCLYLARILRFVWVSMVFSYKHRGLCLYLARILRFVWVSMVLYIHTYIRVFV